jgi:hypothetical protein
MTNKTMASLQKLLNFAAKFQNALQIPKKCQCHLYSSAQKCWPRHGRYTLISFIEHADTVYFMLPDLIGHHA